MEGQSNCFGRLSLKDRMGGATFATFTPLCKIGGQSLTGIVMVM